MGHRRQARELGLQILYQIEYSGQKFQDVFETQTGASDLSEELTVFVRQLVEGTLRNVREIDGLIENASTHWKLSRMASVDRNLLRMAVYELIYLKEIPVSVTINEAVEIAKKFGAEGSAAFINGILDPIAKHRKS